MKFHDKVHFFTVEYNHLNSDSKLIKIKIQVNNSNQSYHFASLCTMLVAIKDQSLAKALFVWSPSSRGDHHHVAMLLSRESSKKAHLGCQYYVRVSTLWVKRVTMWTRFSLCCKWLLLQAGYAILQRLAQSLGNVCWYFSLKIFAGIIPESEKHYKSWLHLSGWAP